MNINIELLLISIIIGVFVMYIYAPVPEIIYKIPSDVDFDNNIFIDTNNVCYKYYKKYNI